MINALEEVSGYVETRNVSAPNIAPAFLILASGVAFFSPPFHCLTIIYYSKLHLSLRSKCSLP